MKRQFIYFLLLLLMANDSFAQTSAQKLTPVSSSLIFPPQSKHTHGSSLVALPNGDFLCAWFMGSGERTADDVKIMGARLQKGAKVWSEPFELADTYNIPDCNPVLFLNSKGKLFLVWIAVNANQWESSVLRFKTSSDFSKPGPPAWNWQDNILLKPNDNFVSEVAKNFKFLPERGKGWSAYAPSYDAMIIEASHDIKKRSIGWMTRIKPLVLDSGKILLPLYSDGYNFSMVAISDNDGTTWRPSLPIVGRGNVQPALALKKDGRIAAYMRDNGDSPARVQVSESGDKGESWSVATESEIPNTASVELLVLKDGRWAFVGNDIEDGRYRIGLFISDDEGKTWKSKYYLENEAPGKGSFSYPSLIQATDGLLHITYSYQMDKTGETIKYVVVNPRQL
ncbi:sialidase family protein [Flavihumibacter profundi]|uniref:sialidase family protein n=1 Tax=Flavihumibacter profundi TaxID=2716883 RepID=UPI001CC42D8D|nr:exo-alpha-sialidase [Flavihumibacter profundi]MBZ5856007.1 exo-alpha-sialidase [Flavihumibacter profundi]